MAAVIESLAMLTLEKIYSISTPHQQIVASKQHFTVLQFF